MANGDPQLSIHGKDVSITWFVGNTPLPDTDNAQSIDINEVNNQVVDKLLGRSADRLDETPGHWELNFGGLYVSPAIAAKLMAQKAARAANQPFDKIAMGLKFTARDGSKHAYMADKCTTNLNIKVGGKDDGVMLNVKLQAETCVVQAL